MKDRAPRFPEIDWYCDRCHAYLNSQCGFDDHNYVWKCTECGYKTSISRADIIDRSKSKIWNIFGKILGLLRTFLIWSIIAFVCEKLIFKANTIDCFRLFPFFVIAYVLIDAFSMVYERVIMKYSNGMKLPIWILSTIFIYLSHDIWRLIYEPLHWIVIIVSYIFAKKRWVLYFIEATVFGFLYTALLIAFIIAIVHFYKEAIPNPTLDIIVDWFSTITSKIRNAFN